MNKKPAIIILLIIALIVVVTLAYTHSVRHHKDSTYNTTPPPSSSMVPSAPSGSPPIGTNGHQGVIYIAGEGADSDQNELVAQTVSLSSSQNPARDSLKALIQADHSPLPPGTRLRGIKIADGLATVDFSREFKDNFHGSDAQEAQAINSILKTLGQFPTIDRVQILVAGQPVDALSQLQISGPLDVVRTEPVRQARKPGGAGHE